MRVVARCLLATLALAVVALALPQRASAWNAVGHMTVAKLAFAMLTPDEQQRLTAILAEHPHYGQYLSAAKPDEFTAGEWAVMRAGVWSDWIRPPRRLEGNPATHPTYRFHRGPWHYVNFAYMAKQPQATLPDQPLGATTDILRQLPLCAEFAGSTTKADPDAEPEITAAQNRAVRVCWLIHLIGDLHQPLHAATLVDERRLPGPHHEDQGGNLLAVRVEIGAYPIKLHAFWDQILGTDNHPTSIARLADSLQQDPTLTAANLPELQTAPTFRDWTAESYAIAKQWVYLEGELPTLVWNDQRPPLPPVDDVPILPVGYERDARQAARKRIVLAAHRLAAQLSAAVK